MTPAPTLATAARVLRQLRRDPRTLALIVGVPCVLETLLHEIFAGRPEVFQHVGAPLLGLFPFVSMFVVTSVTMLRERTSGTLERLMTLPVAKLDLVAGYAAAFAVVAVVQAAVVSALTFWLLGLDVQGHALGVAALAVANAILGMALGLFVSAFARTEFQAVQFMPALVFPQLLLCGLFTDRSAMARWLQLVADCLPLSYAYDAVSRAASGGTLDAAFAADVGVIAAATAAALVLGAVSLPRRTA